MPRHNAGLSPRERKFVEEYMICMDATEAARRAGYSVRSANTLGPRNLQKPQVKAALERAYAARRVEKAITAEKVIEELGEIGFAKVDASKSGVLSAKVAALNTLAKHFGLLLDRQEITGANGGPIDIDNQTAAARIAALMEAARRRKGGDEG